MLLVKIRVSIELLAWDIGTLPTVDKALILTAYRYGTFSVKRVSLCFDASFASAAFLVAASGAVETAS